jgi:heme A synthase
LLIFSAAVAGVVRSPRKRWVTIPPLVAVVLLSEVSYFGAVVVLRGLAPGWAAVDVDSALLVVALMVTAAVTASTRINNPAFSDRLTFKSPFSWLVLAVAAVTYIILVSGILVAGKSSITACLGWPIYSLRLFQTDAHGVGNTIPWIFSLVGIGLVIAVLVLAWRNKQEHPTIFQLARWLGLAALIEAFFQMLLLGFGHQVPLLIVYTVTAAVFWALLVALVVRVGLEEACS